MPRNRKKPLRKQPNYWTGLLVAVVVAAGGLAALNWAMVMARLDDLMPIRHVRVEGEFANLDPESLRKTLLPLVRRNYFLVDFDALEQAAVEEPWVRAVRFSRVWPDTVVVEVQEHEPVARWGRDQLMSESGVVFPKGPGTVSDFSSLPALEGPVGHEAEVLAMLRELNEKFAERATPVADLKLSDRLGWSAVLVDGLEIAYGSKNPLEATDRMLALLPRLRERRPGVPQRLDLRYPSGFAVTWKPEPGPPTAVSDTVKGRDG